MSNYFDHYGWLGLCSNWPLRWPYWVGGNDDFKSQGQPFGKVTELISATSLEF